MSRRTQRGTTLVVGLILLSLVTLLGLAGASTTHIETLLAQDELFRENADTAASAGIELAISQIVNSPDPESVPATVAGTMPDSSDRFEAVIRFAGYELALAQAPGAHVAGAHFEITSTGFGTRRAVDRQRADVMWVVDSPSPATADCEPVLPAHCHERGELERMAWQRVAPE